MNKRLFLFRSDLLGDSIMAESSLRYFEKLYPNSYKIWHLLGKTHQALPIWANNPLIDRIKVSSNLESYDEQDYELMKSCDIVINTRPQHKNPYWYNELDCVQETIQMGGIDLNHFNEILTKDEQFPKLYKYFPIGEFNESHAGYCKDNILEENYNKIISVKPFCGYGKGLNRCPSEKFWHNLINILLDYGYKVNHYGFINEPNLSVREGYRNLTKLSFFDQIKSSLASKMIIGSDDGFMWAMGGYSHKALHLITNWQLNHTQNLLALTPYNKNATNIFYEKGSTPNMSEVLSKIA